VNGETALIFERWRSRWTADEQSDLWRLDLKPGAHPQKIISSAAEPAF